MQETLRNTVAELMGVDPAQIGPDRALNGGRLQGSLGRSLLDAALRQRLGIRSPAVYSAGTFAELESGVMGKSSQGSPAAVSPSGRDAHVAAASIAPVASADVPADEIACGIDMELVAGLPSAADPWENEWYKATFTAAEIAYCLLQPVPARHFAGRWCAKEALKKCEPALLNMAMADLEIVSDSRGAISLQKAVNGTRTALPHVVSISHTAEAAVAVVVRPPSRLASPTIAPPQRPDKPQAAPRSSSQNMFVALCAIASIVISIVTLWIVLRRP
jgi:phosphopantetheine--protein transferase-like protein